jgi:hypothetical protein
MTYIGAFRCHGGAIMCADTLETRGDNKNYVEKIEIVEDHSFPLAVGGAGVEDILKPFMQEIIERVKVSKPATKAALQTEIKETIKTVYENDLPALVLKKQHLTPQFIIVAKPTSEDYCIFPVIGKRLYKEQSRAIIGYPSAYNHALLKRLHRNDLPMQQAVMLAIYLVSQSKQFDDGVGGDSQIVIVRDNGAWIDDDQYVAQAEAYIAEFLKLIDSLFLNSVDVTIPPSKFPDKLQEFVENAVSHRQRFADYSSLRSFQRISEPGYTGNAYNKVFLGAIQEITATGFMPVREETKEEIERRRKVFEDAKNAVNTLEAAKTLGALTQGKSFTAIFKDVPISGRGGKTA